MSRFLRMEKDRTLLNARHYLREVEVAVVGKQASSEQVVGFGRIDLADIRIVSAAMPDEASEHLFRRQRSQIGTGANGFRRQIVSF